MLKHLKKPSLKLTIEPFEVGFPNFFAGFLAGERVFFGSIVAVNCGSISWEGLVVHPCFFVGIRNFFRGDISGFLERNIMNLKKQFLKIYSPSN